MGFTNANKIGTANRHEAGGGTVWAQRVALTGVAGIALLLSGCAPSVADASGVEQEQVQSKVSYPPEAQEWLDTYADRYADPIATYYADAAYEEATGASAAINDFYFDDYDAASGPIGLESTFGFTITKLDPSVDLSHQLLVDIFNVNYEGMSKLANYLAKNPGFDRTAVVIDEFSDYNGYKNPDAGTLAATLQSVIQKYGSAAIYEVMPGALNEEADDEAWSVFRETGFIIDSVDDTGRIMSGNANVHLAIKVTTFDDKGDQTSTIEHINDAQFAVRRASKADDPMGSGFIGVGIR